jgi:hypothetical protein
MENRLKVAQKELGFLDEASRRWIFGESALSVWPWLTERQLANRATTGRRIAPC